MAVKIIPQTQSTVYSPQQVNELAVEHQKYASERQLLERDIKKQQVIDIINKMLPANFNLETKTAMIKWKDLQKSSKIDRKVFPDYLYEIFLSMEDEWHCHVGTMFNNVEYDEAYLFLQVRDDIPKEAQK